ncbi:oxidoreductase [Nocardia sp. MDA0666]|uniref:PDR/VanB family oxidoreductase n=1 Tax=Nocardia sp. MDA0666 TaxID=2135448 RepID=UPI000D136CD0|nr:PDR/VanB family oxidoreductase [Nocardia sp. MDA0666]PSR65745.1 oxidoreductase [Nocardia sp. MDA0666]
MITSEQPAVPAGLRAIATAVDAYKRVFVAGFASDLLSRPNAVRRSGFELTVTIEAITPEAEDVVSVVMRGCGDEPLPAWRPGAHLDVVLPSGRQRQYSLCGDPRDRSRYRIAVRQITDGSASTEVHQSLRAGDRLRIRGPRNAFDLVHAPAYLFIAAGIGITPILPMTKAAGAAGRLIYLGRSRASMPFLHELPTDAEVHCDDEHGVTDIAQLIATAPPGAAVYVCGPPPMVAAAGRCMWQINPTGSLHTERFSAAPVRDGREFTVRLARSGASVRVGARETALTAIRRRLPDVSYSCQQGFCGACKVAVLAGAVDHRDRLLNAQDRDDHMLVCVSRAADAEIVLDL